MMSGNFRPRRRRSPDVNITPLIDVVFLLLIFFMVSTTFDRYAELGVELPQAGAEPAAEQPEHIEITIDRAGHYYVDKREVVSTSLDILRRAIKKALGDREAVPVVISADANTPHQAVITAMDASSRVGLYRITFATGRGAEPAP
jgi:biopolymer transport protein ExbD